MWSTKIVLYFFTVVSTLFLVFQINEGQAETNQGCVIDFIGDRNDLVTNANSLQTARKGTFYLSDSQSARATCKGKITSIEMAYRAKLDGESFSTARILIAVYRISHTLIDGNNVSMVSSKVSTFSGFSTQVGIVNENGVAFATFDLSEDETPEIGVGEVVSVLVLANPLLDNNGNGLPLLTGNVNPTLKIYSPPSLVYQIGTFRGTSSPFPSIKFIIASDGNHTVSTSNVTSLDRFATETTIDSSVQPSGTSDTVTSSITSVVSPSNMLLTNATLMVAIDTSSSITKSVTMDTASFPEESNTLNDTGVTTPNDVSFPLVITPVILGVFVFIMSIIIMTIVIVAKCGTKCRQRRRDAVILDPEFIHTQHPGIKNIFMPDVTHVAKLNKEVQSRSSTYPPDTDVPQRSLQSAPQNFINMSSRGQKSATVSGIQTQIDSHEPQATPNSSPSSNYETRQFTSEHSSSDSVRNGSQSCAVAVSSSSPVTTSIQNGESVSPQSATESQSITFSSPNSMVLFQSSTSASSDLALEVVNTTTTSPGSESQASRVTPPNCVPSLNHKCIPVREGADKQKQCDTATNLSTKQDKSNVTSDEYESPARLTGYPYEENYETCDDISETYDQPEGIIRRSDSDYEDIWSDDDHPYAFPIDAMDDDYEVPGPRTLPRGKHLTSQDYDYDDIIGPEDLYSAPPSTEEEIYMELKQRNITTIDRAAISLKSELGFGQFAIVHKAVWKGSVISTEVAVKLLSTLAKMEERIKFLQEAHIMSQFHHPNITQLYGLIAEGKPKMIIMELMPLGDLRRFLTALIPPPGKSLSKKVPAMLLSFARDVASGMKYLSLKGYIHRDLAARNMLLSNEYTCKIGDFGLSRDLANDEIYQSRGGLIPLRWTAPEAITTGIYSSASDVWSYGVLLYEIWSLAKRPFDNLENNQIISLLKSNKRLPPPPGCPKPMYAIMIDCWHPDSAERPDFLQIDCFLRKRNEELLRLSKDEPTYSMNQVIGTDLVHGHNLYPTLQNSYLA